MEDKQYAHDLIDQIPPGRLPAVVHLLETIVATDGEAVSERERAAIAEADVWLRNNRPIPHEVVLAELGLTMADWEKMATEPEVSHPRR
jgi:hypothetical protein